MLLVVVAINFVAFVVNKGWVATDDRALIAGVVHDLITVIGEYNGAEKKGMSLPLYIVEAPTAVLVALHAQISLPS